MSKDSLSQEEWNSWVTYSQAEGNPPNQRFRAFGILLEDFDFEFRYSDDPDYCKKTAMREIDLLQAKYCLAKIDPDKAKRMYDNASPWGHST